MNFSIVLLSRKRTFMLANLLASIQQTTSQLSQLEVIIGMDIDDEESLAIAENLEERYPFCRTIFRPRQHNMHSYINLLARACSGDFVMVLNDDCEFLTEDWDDMARQEIQRIRQTWKDDIFYIATNDNSIDKVGSKLYASFPMISKKGINTLGFFMEERFPAHGADVGTYRIYDAIKRTVYFDFLKINHVFHSSKEALADKDETALEMVEKTFNHGTDYWSVDVSHHAEKLMEGILRGETVQ